MRSKARGKPGKKPAATPARRAGGRRCREPRSAVAPVERDPLAKHEDLAEDRQAAAMSAEQALDLVLAVRLGPAPEPVLGLSDADFELAAIDWSEEVGPLDLDLRPMDLDLGSFDAWAVLEEQYRRELAEWAGEEGGGPAPEADEGGEPQ